MTSEARTFNAAVMELGAVVCTARVPHCEVCPIAGECAWRAAGYPAYDGARRAVQKKYEGSDRQVRGLILAALRRRDDALPPRGTRGALGRAAAARSRASTACSPTDSSSAHPTTVIRSPEPRDDDPLRAAE